MYKQETARIKAAMVLHALEQDLGDYVRTEHIEIQADGVANSVAVRLSEKSAGKPKPSINQIIEATFLGEILNIATTAANSTADKDHFLRLKKIFENLELSEIRNAVSHPNRPFPESYWHRTAALATDPVIDKIKFTRLIQKYKLACEESLKPPPEEWMNLRRSYIKNNVPDTVDHELTGLIGRDKDLAKLESEIKNGRNSFIALVARGGIGKTALTLECLNNIILNPATADWAEAVIYCTLKQERLTATGIQKLNAASTIEELKVELKDSINYVLLEDCHSLEDLYEKHEKTKLLITIDNLETLLRDNPENFTTLIDNFPRDWKVLVTSRLPVDSAKNTPLESLTRQSSLFLARKYFLSRGYSHIEADTLERIGKSSNDNPLAIRLIADLYLAGKDIDNAISIAANEITSFSFSNLVDALSEDSILVLEGLFSLGNANRALLVETLEISLDRIASAIGQLGKTSLLIRKTNEALEEIYSIDESIRELLRVSPKDADLRRQVNANIGKLRLVETSVIKKQSEQKRTFLDRDFIPRDAPLSLIPIIDKLNTAISKRNSLIIKDIDSKLRSIEELYTNSTLFFKQLTRISYFFGDQINEEVALQSMLKISPKDPYALLSLGYLYRSQQKLPEALAQFDLLMTEGWDGIEESGVTAAISIHQGYISTLVFMQRYDEVIRITNDWKSRGAFRLVYGVARASTFRHLCESTTIQKSQARIHMESATTVLSALTAFEGSPTPILKEQIKVIRNLPGILVDLEDSPQDRQTALRLLKYAYNLLPQIRGKLDGHEDLIHNKLQQISIDGNPFFHQDRGSENLDEINFPRKPIPENYHLAEIYYIPSSSSFPTFMFARDEDGKSYFLQSEKFQRGDWANWILLKIGSSVAVQRVQSKSGSTDYRATDIISI